MRNKTRAEFMRLLNDYDTKMNAANSEGLIRHRLSNLIKAAKLRNELIDKFAPKK